MGLVIRNDDPSLLNSSASGDIAIAPFTLVFKRAGLSFAAHLMNGVVFSAVLSAGNSALFAASRTLMALSVEGKAPSIFSRLNTHGVPVYAILATGLFGCISFLGIFLGDGVLFMWLIQITGISGILTWLSIALIHIRFRAAFQAQNKSIDELIFKSPLYPLGPVTALVLGVVIMIGQGYAAYQESIAQLLVTFGKNLFFHE
jgi:lysine-specific permease